MKSAQREVWIDWLRVAACFMVMVVHSVEPFYLGGEGSLVLSASDAFWSAFMDSFVRACVPLFVVASSYLQFPLHYTAGEFLRRRAVRILVPFVIWSLVYAFVWGNPAENIKALILNFNLASGHLWFVYMLIGLYIIMPVLSPWAEKVGKKELQVYLGIWLFTTLIPLLRNMLGGVGPMIEGSGGHCAPAYFPLWGEANWNVYGTFYYVSGLVGYLLLGLYFRRFVPVMSWGRTLSVALPAWLIGFGITFGGFLRRLLASASGNFPFEGPISCAVGWETTWNFSSIGVALMTIGWILIFRKVNSGGGFYKSVVLPLSKAGYGMYLCHMLILAAFSELLRARLGLGADGILGPVWTTPVQILLTAVCSFVCVGLVSVLLQRIPRIGKYIIG